MKLELHLIPQSTFYFNLRNFLGKEWNKLSKEIRSKNGRTCQLCGWKEQQGHYTHLHEVWEFNDELLEQKLKGFECLCPTCHAVHHWGLSQLQGKNMDYLLRHACKVNNCSKEEFTTHVCESFIVWEKRSKQQWQINYNLGVLK